MFCGNPRPLLRTRHRHRRDEADSKAGMSALPAFRIANVFTGELLDPDDLPALKTALEEIEDYLAEKRRPLRRIYQARDQIQARVAELDPITLPKRRWQTDKQQRVARCPYCAHVIEDSADRRADSDSAEEGPRSPTPPERGSADHGAGDGGTH